MTKGGEVPSLLYLSRPASGWTRDPVRAYDRYRTGRQSGSLTVDGDNVFEPGRGLYLTGSDRDNAAAVWLRYADAGALAVQLEAVAA